VFQIPRTYLCEKAVMGKVGDRKSRNIVHGRRPSGVGGWWRVSPRGDGFFSM
jgi:hypothetical protein